MLHKVLLIDDNKVLNEYHKKLLTKLSIADSIVSTDNGLNAISLLQSIRSTKELPELIFLDLEMPSMNGFEFLEHYLKLEIVVNSNYNPVITIVSDYLDFKNFSQSKLFKSIGVLEHIRKPLEQEDVLALIEEHFYEKT